ncbi:MAG: hypothetical protein BMS9Abin08_0686 [Gammaproteobacteria bacterium]|nr:MAG: hypothetical protein BMS9Abin08_0686 [Gammaproteobacteria bacterium]
MHLSIQRIMTDKEVKKSVPVFHVEENITLGTWADNLEAQFACAEQLVEEGRAFFDPENLERLKSLPLSEESVRLMRSVQWSSAMAVSKRK